MRQLLHIEQLVIASCRTVLHRIDASTAVAPVAAENGGLASFVSFTAMIVVTASSRYPLFKCIHSAYVSGMVPALPPSTCAECAVLRSGCPAHCGGKACRPNPARPAALRPS